MSGFNCCFWTCIQVSQETGKVVWYSHLFKYFPQFFVIYTVNLLQYSCLENHVVAKSQAWLSNWTTQSKALAQAMKQKQMFFLEFSCFPYDPTNVGNSISGSSAFFKPSLYIWKFSVHILLKSSLKNFEHYLASMWNELKCMVVWAFFGIALLWDWNQTDYILCIWRRKNYKLQEICSQQ